MSKIRVFQQNGRGKYYVELKDHHRHVRRFAGFTDKTNTETFGSNIRKLIACKASGDPPSTDLSSWVNAQPERLRTRFAEIGLISRRQAGRAKLLTDLLQEFRPTLLEKKGSTRQQKEVMGLVTRVIKGCKASRWEDLTKKQVVSFLDRRLELDADTESKVRFGVKTYNDHVLAIKRFSAWLRKELGLETDPLEDLEKRTFVKAKHSKHARRALTQSQAIALLDVAKVGPDILGMTGQQRYLTYKVAIETGLRANEIRSLTRECFDFSDMKDPRVRLSGRHTKNGKDAVLPLRHDTAVEIRAYIKWRVGAPFPLHHRSSVMIRRDCEAAGIPYVDHEGRFADFHALRHTCGTFLAQAGTHPKVAQKIMRHSDIRLTMDLYTDYTEGSDRPAVESLWKFQMTGTDS